MSHKPTYIGIAFLSALSLLGGCSTSGGSGSAELLSDYVKAVTQRDNGLHSTVNQGVLTYALSWEPGLFKFIKENRREVKNLDPNEIESGAQEYSDIYLELKIKTNSPRQDWIVQTWQEESVKPKTNLAKMVCGSDTIFPLGLHLVAGQGVEGSTLVNLTFPACSNPDTDYQFLIKDLSSENRGNILFDFDPTIIQSFSTLNP